MTDIVERLDDFSKCYAELSGTTDEVLMSVEAATEIRQLRAANARLREALERIREITPSWELTCVLAGEALAETDAPKVGE